MSKPCGTKGRGSIGMLAIGVAEERGFAGDVRLKAPEAECVHRGETEEQSGEVEEARGRRGWKLGKDPKQSSLKEETSGGSRAGPTNLNQSRTASKSQASIDGLGKVANFSKMAQLATRVTLKRDIRATQIPARRNRGEILS